MLNFEYLSGFFTEIRHTSRFSLRRLASLFRFFFGAKTKIWREIFFQIFGSLGGVKTFFSSMMSSVASETGVACLPQTNSPSLHIPQPNLLHIGGTPFVLPPSSPPLDSAISHNANTSAVAPAWMAVAGTGVVGKIVMGSNGELVRSEKAEKIEKMK